MVEPSSQLEVFVVVGIDVALGPERIRLEEFRPAEVVLRIDSNESLRVVAYRVDQDLVRRGALFTRQVSRCIAVWIDERLERDRLVVAIDDGDRCIGNSVFQGVPLPILVVVSPHEALDALLVGHVRGAANHATENVAGERQLGFHRSDFDRLADLRIQDRDLEIQVDGVGVGSLNRSPWPGIDPVLDAPNLVEGNVVLSSRGIAIWECLNRGSTTERVGLELRTKSTGTFELERNIQDIKDPVVIGVSPSDLGQGRFWRNDLVKGGRQRRA